VSGAQLDEARVEASGLRKLLDIKTRELNYIKVPSVRLVCTGGWLTQRQRLAQALLDQRTDVERFLLDSLELVYAMVGAESFCSDVAGGVGAKRNLICPAVGRRQGTRDPCVSPRANTLARTEVSITWSAGPVWRWP
jgi:hypothetical protein